MTHYYLDATNGNLLHTFLSPIPGVEGEFGTSVSISGNNILIGSNDDAGVFAAGAAYLFDATTGNLLQTFLNPTPEVFDLFGDDVSISGNNILIGAGTVLDPETARAASLAGAEYIVAPSLNLSVIK